ncbi:glycosyltransferase family 2 protein [Polynucleobacter sp. KF022]|uniref:glycosyltransferase family 2 protein n=1 Tax=Polynucleobacter sp. KF022 TaxID=2982615 RepID=UPI0024903C52|nr:glycosyltransferase family 2 protein [Polynucleobacter sp. KF022]
MENFLLVVPTFNCEKQISRVVEQFALCGASVFKEMIIIDNRSEDGTIEVSKAAIERLAQSKISIYLNDKNFGLGGSHKVAFNYCLSMGYDGIVILHGDDQGRLMDIIPYILDPSFSDDQCLLGARFMSNSRVSGYKKIRTIGNIIFNILYTMVTRSRVYDMGSGLNFFSSKVISSFDYKKMPDDLTFNNAFLLALLANQQKIKFFPISWREEDQVSNAKLWSQSLRLLKYLVLYLRSPLLLLSTDFSNPSNKFYSSSRVPMLGEICK